MDDKPKKTVEARMKSEKARLNKIYKPVLDKGRFALAAGLIQEAAWMRVQLDDLKADLTANGWTELFQQGQNQTPYERARPSGQSYNTLNANYQKIIKQLEGMIPKQDPKAAADAAGKRDDLDILMDERDAM